MADQNDDGGGAEAVRDQRIDYLGFAAELEKHLIEPIKDELRSAYPVGTRLEGDHFKGLIAAPVDKRTISASGWLRLRESGLISRDDYLAGITVSPTVAERVCDSRTFKRLVKVEPGKPTIRKERKDDAAGVDLLGAVRGLGRSIESARRAA